MNTFSTTRCVLFAATALVPLLALGAETNSLGPIQSCMDKFVAEHFPDSRVTFVTEDVGPSLPLDANRGTRQVELVARERVSGRVLAKGLCEVNPTSTKVGRIIITPTPVEK